MDYPGDCPGIGKIDLLKNKAEYKIHLFNHFRVEMRRKSRNRPQFPGSLPLVANQGDIFSFFQFTTRSIQTKLQIKKENLT